MSDSRDNNGFDWSSESEKMKNSLSSYGQEKRRNDFRKEYPKNDSVFFDGHGSDYGYTYSPDSFSSYGDFEKRTPLREDSIYYHSSGGKKVSDSKNTSKSRNTDKRTVGNKNQKRPSAGGKNTSEKKKGKPKAAPASQKSAGKTQTEKMTKNQPAARRDGKRPDAKSVSQLKKRVDESEKRRIEKSSESYDRAIRQGKSKDELRKKRAKKKRIARKIKIAATVFAVFVFAVIFALVFCFTRGAPIEKITVEGATIYKESEILAAAGISEGDNMLMIRQKRTNEAVTTVLPYISKIKVDYQLPDTLRLVVTETDEKYYIVNGQAYICVDPDDKVVSDVKKKIKGDRYRIEGLTSQEYTVGKTFVPEEENGNEKKYVTAKKIVDAIEKAGLKNCNVINVENPDRIYVVYNSKLWMYLKEDSDFEYEMKFAAKALSDSKASEIISTAERSYIDLRLGNQAVFKTGKLS